MNTYCTSVSYNFLYTPETKTVSNLIQCTLKLYLVSHRRLRQEVANLINILRTYDLKIPHVTTLESQYTSVNDL